MPYPYLLKLFAPRSSSLLDVCHNDLERLLAMADEDQLGACVNCTMWFVLSSMKTFRPKAIAFPQHNIPSNQHTFEG